MSRYRRIALDNLINGQSSSEVVEDDRHHHPSASDTGLTVTDIRIDGYVLTPTQDYSLACVFLRFIIIQGLSDLSSGLAHACRIRSVAKVRVNTHILDKTLPLDRFREGTIKHIAYHCNLALEGIRVKR